MVVACGSAHGADVNSAAADLRAAFREAARDAKTRDDLDPGYELLGIAETAQQQNLPQIAAEAATAFADLVKRAAAKALRTGGSAAEDTLDQFVDLRFMARTANLPLPQAALDDAMASLFPPVAAAVQRKFEEAPDWSAKLTFADDLADLQASATQIMKEDIAKEMGEAFDKKPPSWRPPPKRPPMQKNAPAGWRPWRRPENPATTASSMPMPTISISSRR